MQKIIKRWGGSIVLRFSPEEAKMFFLKEGDIIELNDEDFKRHAQIIKDAKEKESTEIDREDKN